jgi:arsenate reductase-like glutaredoxin family protein
MDDRRWSKTMHLSESDLRFLVETVATNRRDYDHIVNLVRDKEDLLETMLEHPKLTERLFRDE